MCQQSSYSFVQKYELKKKKTWFQHTQETKFLFFKYYLREEFKAKKKKKKKNRENVQNCHWLQAASEISE